MQASKSLQLKTLRSCCLWTVNYLVVRNGIENRSRNANCKGRDKHGTIHKKECFGLC